MITHVIDEQYVYILTRQGWVLAYLIDKHSGKRYWVNQVVFNDAGGMPRWVG